MVEEEKTSQICKTELRKKKHVGTTKIIRLELPAVCAISIFCFIITDLYIINDFLCSSHLKYHTFYVTLVARVLIMLCGF